MLKLALYFCFCLRSQVSPSSGDSADISLYVYLTERELERQVIQGVAQV